jgi:hypothetical protein
MNHLLKYLLALHEEKVKNLHKSLGDGHEQSPTHANTPLLLQAIYVAATTKSNKKIAAPMIPKCH